MKTFFGKEAQEGDYVIVADPVSYSKNDFCIAKVHNGVAYTNFRKIRGPKPKLMPLRVKQSCIIVIGQDEIPEEIKKAIQENIELYESNHQKENE